MMNLIHLFIEAVYLLCPAVMFVRAVTLSISQNRSRPLRQLRLTAIAGTGAGVVVCILYASSLGAKMVFTQVLLTGYLATSLMLLLQLFDRGLWKASQCIFQLKTQKGPAWWYGIRAVLGLLVRTAIVFCIGLPYVLVAVTTFRPKVVSTQTPATLYNWTYSRVSFASTDGVPLVGWWIPAPGGESRRTVLLCPGSNADKASQLFLVKKLQPDGYNVLVFDFRARGESGGQICSFGDLERKDVLGAMRWLRKNHPTASHRVAGIGVSTGAAALLAAAADPSPEGQNIDAIAVYDTFDRLDNQVDSMVQTFVPSPLGWFVRKFGLTMASYQVGTKLADFAPSTDIQAISVRPLLVIHGTDDELIPFAEGQALYELASEPKLNFWIEDCRHDKALHSVKAADFVKRCFDSARSVVRTVI